MDRVDSRSHRRSAAWLSTCAMGVALTAMPHAAHAQAFQGTPAVVDGSALIATPTATTTNIVVNSSEVVIDWSPFDTIGSGNIDFLPAGSTAAFSEGNSAQYTVLNRILPADTNGAPTARIVELNGAISSTLGGVQGGNIWFYTPTGFIVGPTATIQAGSAILTTDDIVFGSSFTGGTELYGPAGQVFFRGPAGSKGSVQVMPGAQVMGSGINSYVAMVAPRVVQGGTVSASRSVAYIAAEQVDLTINAGLFDIAILAGTSDANGVVHTGTTTGTASTGSGDVKQISFVALPKATALTMMLSGSIGYAAAASAANDGSSVVLSAGFDSAKPTTEVAGSLGNIAIDNAAFANSTNGYASGTIDITALGGPVTFGTLADLPTALFAQDAINVDLSSGGQVNASGPLTLSAAHGRAGGSVDVALANNASMLINGALTIDASSTASALASTAGPDATGGTVAVNVDSGSIDAVSLDLYAGAYGEFDPMLGGNATGGTISMSAINGGSISNTALYGNAEASGGASDGTGGNAIAGSIDISSTNAALNFSTVSLDASALGGVGTIQSGSATGGHVGITLDNSTNSWSNLSVNADAASDFTAGQSGPQGNSATAIADAIDLSLLNGATLDVGGDISLSASAAASIDGVGGTSGQGGGINITVHGGSSLGFFNLSALAQASVNLTPIEAFSAITPVTTPDTLGGAVSLLVDGGQVAGYSISLGADATGLGASSSAGSARGGSADLGVLNGGTLTLDDGSGGASLLINANALGAAGAATADAVGGTASLRISDSTVDVLGSSKVTAAAKSYDDAVLYPSGPLPLTGFDATGGTASVQLLAGTSGTASLSTDTLGVDATGDATRPEFFYPGGSSDPPPPPAGIYGGPIDGDGGTGTGGNASIGVAAGNLSITDATISADGLGGISAASAGLSPYSNGDGFGGTSNFSALGGASTIGSLTLNANGDGGGLSSVVSPSSLGPLAGDGTGGSVAASIGGGSLTTDNLTVEAGGTGGAGASIDGAGIGTDGGQGNGGIARLLFVPGATGTLTGTAITIMADGNGGAGGTTIGGTDGYGGNGAGGTASEDLADGALTAGSTSISAKGTGGVGTLGGEGNGGTASLTLTDTVGPAGGRTIDGLNIVASGIGGVGTSGTADSDAGSVTLNLAASGIGSGLVMNSGLLAQSRGTRAAPGAGFTATITGAPLTVNGNADIDTARDACHYRRHAIQRERQLHACFAVADPNRPAECDRHGRYHQPRLHRRRAHQFGRNHVAARGERSAVGFDRPSVGGRGHGAGPVDRSDLYGGADGRQCDCDCRLPDDYDPAEPDDRHSQRERRGFARQCGREPDHHRQRDRDQRRSRREWRHYGGRSACCDQPTGRQHRRHVRSRQFRARPDNHRFFARHRYRQRCDAWCARRHARPYSEQRRGEFADVYRRHGADRAIQPRQRRGAAAVRRQFDHHKRRAQSKSYRSRDIHRRSANELRSCGQSRPGRHA